MDSKSISPLNGIWIRGGIRQLRHVFTLTAEKNAVRALQLINDREVSFPVLFLLIDDIYALGLFQKMSSRNKTAMRLCAYKAMKSARPVISWDDADGDILHTTLRWMIATGKNWGGPYEGHDAYDALLDYAAALLTINYDDRSVLPDIADLIFRRNRKGLYIHDLVWSFFQALDVNTLKLVAERLKSADERDVELAGKLLRLDITMPMDRRKKAVLYERYIRWLDENRPYLYLTGEHFQMSNRPNHLDFDREAKYLHKAVSPRLRTPEIPMTENELDCLRQFRQASRDEREVLATYSQKLWARDEGRWHDWMKGQIAEQVISARKELETADAYY